MKIYSLYLIVNSFFTDSGNFSADSAVCSMATSLIPEFPIYELSCVVFFLIPMIILLFLYLQMSLKIHKSIKNCLGSDFSNTSVHQESTKIRSRRTVIRMLSWFSNLVFIIESIVTSYSSVLFLFL